VIVAQAPGELPARAAERIPDWPRVRSMMVRLASAGYNAYLVGGAVRDLMLGMPPGDADILTDADPDEVCALFRDQRVRRVGQRFSICLVDGVEVASCRYPKASDRMAADPGFPAADLSMRDLTVNSMALDPFSGQVVDPFGGKQDLCDRVIRFTRNPAARILEDPLRLVRACRFAARDGWEMDPASAEAIADHSGLLAQGAAPERVQAELLKAMSLNHPSRFFTLLHDTGLLTAILPCLDRCHGLDGGPHHGESVFEHCLLVGDALPPGQPLLRLAGYIHDAGKYEAAVVKEGRLTFAGHETHDQAISGDLEALRFSRQDTAYILSLVRVHMRPLNPDSTPKAVRRLLAMLDGLGLGYRDFLRLRIADRKANLAKTPYTLSEIRVRLEKILAQRNPETPTTLNALAITGREICNLLKMPPGPGVGRIKQHLFDQVLADPSLNTPDRLAELVRKSQP
jgi:tRNA nucleotidyltransferase (CCA-adding enzyme)